MNLNTKVKYIHSGMTGVEEVKNEFGSLVRILKTVLVDGFNEVTSSGASVDNEVLTVSLNVAHGFLEHQVISIRGSGNPLVDKEHRIKSATNTSIKVNIPGLTSISGVLAIKVAPLGYELVFNEIEAKGIACFKNKNPVRPAILKVIDALPPNGYNNSWGKYARVVAGYDLNEEGNFVFNTKLPKDPVSPDLEVSGNGVQGASGIHGYLKWDYAIRGSWDQDGEEADGVIGTFPTSWQIIGDDRTFYLFIKSAGKSIDSYNILSFGDIDSEQTTFILTGADRNRPADNSSNFKSGVAWNIGLSRCQSFEGNFIANNLYERYEPELRFTLCSLGFNNYWPSLSSNISSIDITGGILNTPAYIRDIVGSYRGKMRGMYFIYNFTPYNGTMLKDTQIFLTTKKYNGKNHNEENVCFLFSLEDWD